MDKLTLLYDGACVVCNKEVMHYLDLDKEKLIIPVNISDKAFSAVEYGLTNEAVNLHMHAIDEKGSIYIGIDSFIEIWRRIPRYKILIPLFENQYLRPAFNVGYDIFAKYVRPKLPKKSCDDGQCSI